VVDARPVRPSSLVGCIEAVALGQEVLERAGFGRLAFALRPVAQPQPRRRSVVRDALAAVGDPVALPLYRHAGAEVGSR
jgi:hypothetical protein